MPSTYSPVSFHFSSQVTWLQMVILSKPLFRTDHNAPGRSDAPETGSATVLALGYISLELGHIKLPT